MRSIHHSLISVYHSFCRSCMFICMFASVLHFCVYLTEGVHGILLNVVGVYLSQRVCTPHIKVIQRQSKFIIFSNTLHNRQITFCKSYDKLYRRKFLQIIYTDYFSSLRLINKFIFLFHIT